MRARGANIQRAATKITNMPFGGQMGFVCSLSNELNSNSKEDICFEKFEAE